MPRTRRHQRMYQTAPNISLTPLIDTALTLLVVFMVAAPVAHHAVQVDLPQGSNDNKSVIESPQHEFTITIDRAGNLFLDRTMMKRPEVINAIRNSLKNSKKSPTLYLQVDRASQAGLAIEMLTELQGIEGIGCVEFAIEAQRSPS